jgi:hypothetical protein
MADVPGVLRLLQSQRDQNPGSPYDHTDEVDRDRIPQASAGRGPNGLGNKERATDHAPIATGSPAAFQSGNPSWTRRARYPCRRSNLTASSE